MDIYALFEDGTSNRFVFSFYDSDPGCRIKIDFPPSLSDLQVRNSADAGIHCAYQSLRRLNYIAEREDYYLRCRFDDTDVNTKVLGASAGLGFSLKFAQEIYRAKTGKSLNCSVAATGMIDETGCKVRRVNGINQKIDAAIDCLRKGDKFFYPTGNEKEVDPEKKAHALQKGIELIPVLTVDEAINMLLPLDATGDGGKPTPKWGIKLFVGAMALLILLAIVILWPKPPPKCEADEFLYKKQYEVAQQKYLAYLADKQRFDDLPLFVESVRGVRVPIHPVRLYIANQPDLASIVEAVREGKTYPDKGQNKIVLIAGGPGAGKSPLLKWMACRSEDPEYPPINGEIALLDLGIAFRAQNREDDPECRQEPIPAHYTTLEGDLTIDGVSISNLPKIDADLLKPNGNATETLHDVLNQFGFTYGSNCDRIKVTSEMNFTAIIVDSIDEVAPSSSKKLLELLTAYKQENPAMTIIAAGRGEGFREYAITNIGSYEYHHLEPIYLSTERLIEWRISDWLIYKLIVSGDAKDIPRAEVTIDDLESVEFEKKVKELKRRFDEALANDPWLRNFLFMLLPSNKLFSNIFYHPEKDIRETWASSIFVRSCRVHNRPTSLLDLTRFKLYKKTLQQAARKAKVVFGDTPPGVSELNFKTPSFILSTLFDDVGVEMEGRKQGCVNVSTIRILERSGFVDILPIDGEQYNVMFFPPVVQEILAEF
jgi:hypothetical protein